jgi:hypothetical protein
LGVSEKELLDPLCISLKHDALAAGAQVLKKWRTAGGASCCSSQRAASSGFDHGGLGPEINQ